MAEPLTPAPERAAGRTMDTKRLYATVAACAVVVYVGALWNRFVIDDIPLIVTNPLVAGPAGGGIWRAFGAPYWPPEMGGHSYRPLTIVTFAVDHLLDGAAWFHAVNLLWHAAASVAVAALPGAGPTRRARSSRGCCSPCTPRTSKPSRASPGAQT